VNDLVNDFVVPLLLVHAVAHLVGFVGPWRLMDLEGVTFQSSLFDGRLQVSGRTMRGLGLVWLGLACGFFAVAFARMLGAGWWNEAATALALASLVMCAVNWPAARLGAVANLVVLLVLTIISI
jgi:hypothetical protein